MKLKFKFGINFQQQTMYIELIGFNLLVIYRYYIYNCVTVKFYFFLFIYLLHTFNCIDNSGKFYNNCNNNLPVILLNHNLRSQRLYIVFYFHSDKFIIF